MDWVDLAVGFSFGGGVLCVEWFRYLGCSIVFDGWVDLAVDFYDDRFMGCGVWIYIHLDEKVIVVCVT